MDSRLYSCLRHQRNIIVKSLTPLWNCGCHLITYHYWVVTIITGFGNSGWQWAFYTRERSILVICWFSAACSHQGCHPTRVSVAVSHPPLSCCSSNHPVNQPEEPKCSKLTTCSSGPISAGFPTGRDECRGKEEAGTPAQDGSTHADRIIPRHCRAASWASPFRWSTAWGLQLCCSTWPDTS